MPQSRTARDDFKRNGRRYVTKARAAELWGVSKTTITNAIKRGTIKESHIEGREFICISTEGPKFEKWMAEKRMQGVKATVGEKAQKKMLQEASFAPAVMKKPASVKTPEVGEVKLKNVEVGELDDGKGGSLVIYGVNPEDHLDCCVVKLNEKNEKEYVLDENGNKMLNYELLEQKFMALLRVQQYQQKSGELIEKAVVVKMLEKVAVPLKTAIVAIPQRYSNRIVTILKKAGVDVGNEVVTQIQTAFRDETNQILKNFQHNIEGVADEG